MPLQLIALVNKEHILSLLVSIKQISLLQNSFFQQQRKIKI